MTGNDRFLARFAVTMAIIAMVVAAILLVTLR
jgi:hypothetical protein